MSGSARATFAFGHWHPSHPTRLSLAAYYLLLVEITMNGNKGGCAQLDPVKTPCETNLDVPDGNWICYRPT